MTPDYYARAAQYNASAPPSNYVVNQSCDTPTPWLPHDARLDAIERNHESFARSTAEYVQQLESRISALERLTGLTK